LDLPTAYWNHWVDAMIDREAGQEWLTSLRRVILGGESISKAHVLKWQAALPSVPVINTYGPTETTVICTWHEVAELTDADGDIPIGKPIANAQLYVLNNSLEPVALGETGQLYVAGDGVSQGYLNVPDKTASSFITMELDGKKRRLYATGDQVYIDSHTLNAHYVGRVDSVIKLRGYRVDLSDVKKLVEEHPAVRLAYVGVRTVGSDKTLVAYVQAEGEIPASTLSDQIVDRVPRRLHPIRICFVNEWPLNANGKVDIKRLSEFHVDGAALGGDGETAGQTNSSAEIQQTATESALQAIWQDILGVPVSDLDRTFFDMGGHSLHAIAMLTKIQRSLNVKLTVDVLFKHPSISALASQIDSAGQSSEEQAVVVLSNGKAATNLFLFPPVGGELFCYKVLAEKLSDAYTVYGCRDRHLSAPDQPLSVVQMAAEYVDQIKQVQSDGPYVLAGWSMGGVVAQEVAHLLENRGEEVRQVILVEAWHPSGLPEIDLSYDALARSYVNDLVLSNPSRRADAALAFPVGHDLREMWRSLIDSGVIDEDSEFSTFYRYFQVYRNNSMALRRHVPKETKGPTLLFRSTCPAPHVASSPAGLGWHGIVADLTVIDNEADHYSQLHGSALGSLVEAVLNAASSRSISSEVSEAVDEVL
jgi:thioesterase domain-containing protein/acyl carrier protein